MIWLPLPFCSHFTNLPLLTPHQCLCSLCFSSHMLGPLYLLFFLPAVLFSQIFTWHICSFPLSICWYVTFFKLFLNFYCWHYYKCPPLTLPSLLPPPPSLCTSPNCTTLLSVSTGYACMFFGESRPVSLSHPFRPPPHRSVSLCHVSLSLVLFCLSAYFVL